jgi:hypothetical protein
LDLDLRISLKEEFLETVKMINLKIKRDKE